MKRFLLLVGCAPLLLLTAGCGKSGGGAAAVSLEDGQKVYAQYCATCHQPKGQGVPGEQPAMVNDAVVKGDPATLIAVIVHGPNKVLPANRERWPDGMSAFGGALSDEQVANVASYLRKEFGGGAAAVDSNQAKAVRDNPPRPQS